MIETTKILIVDDESEYRETYKMLLEDQGFVIGEAESTQDALSVLEDEYYPIVLSDIIMPGKDGMYLLNEIKRIYGDTIEVIIVTGDGSVEDAVKAMKIGALGYFIKSRNPSELFLEIEKAKRLIRYEVKETIAKASITKKIFLSQTESPIMKKIIKDIEAISSSSCNVLLTGESGVGKEIFAKLIHDMSDRSKSLFLPTNCQAISENLIEAELFGYEKGSFTGATTKRIGRFEEANGGTMFLDEIGELSNNIQVKLLRVLDNRYIERIGANKQIPVNYRLITATNRDLHKEIEEGRFRKDLFYRINTINIEIPPLRDRKEDLPEMIDFFSKKYSNEMNKDIKGMERNTQVFLLNYDYPGNIRELKNMIERMIVLSVDGILRMDNIKDLCKYTEKVTSINVSMPYKKAKKIFEIEYIESVMKICDYNITQAAKVMEISRRQLFNKLIEFNLKRVK